MYITYVHILIYIYIICIYIYTSNFLVNLQTQHSTSQHFSTGLFLLGACRLRSRVCRWMFPALKTATWWIKIRRFIPKNHLKIPILCQDVWWKSRSFSNVCFLDCLSYDAFSQMPSFHHLCIHKVILKKVRWKTGRCQSVRLKRMMSTREPLSGSFCRSCLQSRRSVLGVSPPRVWDCGWCECRVREGLSKLKWGFT